MIDNDLRNRIRDLLGRFDVEADAFNRSSQAPPYDVTVFLDQLDEAMGILRGLELRSRLACPDCGGRDVRVIVERRSFESDAPNARIADHREFVRGPSGTVPMRCGSCGREWSSVVLPDSSIDALLFLQGDLEDPPGP